MSTTGIRICELEARGDVDGGACVPGCAGGGGDGGEAGGERGDGAGVDHRASCEVLAAKSTVDNAEVGRARKVAQMEVPIACREASRLRDSLGILHHLRNAASTRDVREAKCLNVGIVERIQSVDEKSATFTRKRLVGSESVENVDLAAWHDWFDLWTR